MAEKKEHKKYFSIRKNYLTKKEILWLKNLSDNGIAIFNQGCLSIIRWKKTEKGKFISSQCIINDLDSAIRIQDHILEKYKINQGELDLLDSIEEVINRANQILTNWKKASESKKENLQFEILSTILMLSKCRNEFKVNIKERLEEVSEYKDRLDRVNPGAMAARTVASLNDLGKRFKEVSSIIPIVALRKEFLLLERRRIEVQFTRCEKKLQYIRRIQPLKNQKLLPSQKNIINVEFGKALYFLNNIWSSPYYENAEELKKILKNAKNKLRSDKLSEVKKLINQGISLITNIEFNQKTKTTV